MRVVLKQMRALPCSPLPLGDLDLEDAVAPADKSTARAALAAAVPSVGRNGAKVFVRINAEPELLPSDAAAACRAGAYGLYVPKVRSPEALAGLAAFLAPIEAELGRDATVFVAIIEDPGAVLDARLIAKAPRLLALSVGGEDLALQLGGEPTPDVLRLPKLLVHYAAKADRRLCRYGGHYRVGARSTPAWFRRRHLHPSGNRAAAQCGFCAECRRTGLGATGAGSRCRPERGVRGGWADGRCTGDRQGPPDSRIRPLALDRLVCGASVAGGR